MSDVLEELNKLAVYDYAVVSLRNSLNDHVWRVYELYLKRYDMVLGCYPCDWDIGYIEDDYNTIKITEIIFYSDYDRMDIWISIPIEEFI